MPKPPTSVRSIRLPDEVWARLAAYGAKHELSVNAVVAKAVQALWAVATTASVNSTRKADLSKAAQSNAKPVASAVPLYESKPFNPRPKKGKKP